MPTRYKPTRWLPWLLLMCLSPNAVAEETHAPFSFGLIGDLPYHEPTITWQRLMDAMRAEPLVFVAHVGDIKAGDQPCTDAYLHYIRDEFQCSRHPWFYTPGDNEWMDCNRESAGGFDPIERLNQLRSLFANPTDATIGGHSFGHNPLPLVRQAELPENLRWDFGGVTFAAIHLVGGELRRQPQDSDTVWQARQEEYAQRGPANTTWLSAAFAHAKAVDSVGVMLFMQANLWAEDSEVPPYPAVLAQLRQEVMAFGRPVALAHGDTHAFRVDMPLRDDQGRLPGQFIRVETFGGADVHWVRVEVDARDPALFRITPQIVAANLTPAPAPTPRRGIPEE